MCNGFTSYNGTCIGFNEPLSAGNWLPSIGGLLKPMNPNVMSQNTLQKTIFNG